MAALCNGAQVIDQPINRSCPGRGGGDRPRVEPLFSEAGAYREGHFKLKSGRHGDRYIEKFQVLQWPDRVTELCRLIADRAWSPGGISAVDVVIGPTTGGVILAYEVARQLGVRGIFAEQVTAADGTTSASCAVASRSSPVRKCCSGMMSSRPAHRCSR